LLKSAKTINQTEPKNYNNKTVAEDFDQLNTNSDTKMEGIQHKSKMWVVFKRKIVHGQSVGKVNRKIISEEGVFIWWLKRDLKGE
jgi:hypothetical protein